VFRVCGSEHALDVFVGAMFLSARCEARSVHPASGAGQAFAEDAQRASIARLVGNISQHCFVG
jgi:hypothetical protein